MKKFALVFLVLVVSLLSVSASAQESITVCNWYDYIDPAVLDIFEEETGIHVNYVYATTNEEMYTKLTSGGGSYDLLFPSEYMIERLAKEGLLAEIDLSNVPNLSLLLPRFQDPEYDPGCQYSVPYMWGTLGIIYNTELVKSEITGWKDLFDEQYAGEIIMMNSVRDSMTVGLRMLGYSINTRDEDELYEAADLLIAQKEDGIVGAYLLDETKDKMVAGEAALAVIYSGDAVYAVTKNPSLRYIIPSEGSNIWVDGMCIPANCSNKAGAEAFINFLCRDDISAMNQEYIGYCTPNAAVYNATDPADPAAYIYCPSEEDMANCEYYYDISDINDLITEIWMDILTA